MPVSSTPNTTARSLWDQPFSFEKIRNQLTGRSMGITAHRQVA